MSLLGQSIEFPEEVLVCIFDYLDDPRSLCRLSAVNRSFHRLASDESLWRGTFERANYEQTPYEESEGVSFRVLYKRKYILGRQWTSLVVNTMEIDYSYLDKHWRTSTAHYHFKPPSVSTGGRIIEHLAADVASGGRRPIVALAYSTHVHVYMLKSEETKPMVINDSEVMDLALFLDADRASDEMDGYIGPGVSRGWGNTFPLLVTGGRSELKLWVLPIG
jgi:hypothetical protein